MIISETIFNEEKKKPQVHKNTRIIAYWYE